MSRRLRSLIGQLSFDLVPNIVLAKTNIALIRDTRHFCTRSRIDRGRVCLSSQTNKIILICKMYSSSFSLLFLAVRTSTVATALRKVTTITST